MPEFSGTLVVPYNPVSGQWESGYVPPVGQIVITGAGFGSPPPVVMYADWSNLVDGETLDNSDAIIGTWDSGSYNTGFYPKAVAAHGVTGASLREGGDNAATNNRLTGFVKQYAAKRNFLIAYEIAVPAGRTFPGSATENTLPGVSAVKPAWLSDQALDELAKADVVAASWIGSSFNFIGNQVPYNMFMSNTYDFDGYNGVICSSVAGANAFADNANLYALFCNADSGTTIATKTDVPAFVYREGYKPSIAAAGTLFRVTINGTNCDYTQQAGDTTNTNIATGIKAAIDAQALSGITTSQIGSQVLADTTLGNTFSSTVSVNITKVQMQPQYTHIQVPAWSGNGSQDLAQLAFKYFYIAAADDDTVNKRVELLDNADYSLSTIHRVIYPTETGDFWSDTAIGITPSATLRAGATHICVTLPNGTQTIEAI